ncbi:MAG: hypothetical protein OXD43_01015 [Bacteroidetes bacterium]|nr:hypothetical protein [Bacteroidota bacterium]
MCYTNPHEHAELNDLTPVARQALWSIFYIQVSHNEGAKNVPTKEWDFVLRRLHLDFLGKGIDEYDSCLKTISAQYKPVFLEGHSSQVIRILQMAMERLAEAKKLIARDCISLLDFLETVARPKPRGNFVRLLHNTFKEFDMPYYVDMSSGEPIIVPVSNPVEKDSIKHTLSVLPKYGYSNAEKHFRSAIKYQNKQDWKGSINESIKALESVAVTIKETPKPTLGSAIVAIRKDGKVHTTLCDAMNSIWSFTNKGSGIRHGQPEKDDQMHDQVNTVARKESGLMLSICMQCAVYLAETYKKSPTKKEQRGLWSRSVK